MPCYTVGGTVYRTAPDSDSVDCNFAADGYRLPTEAEWEKAARGGLVGLNFPWDDTISHSQANYCVYSEDGITNYYSYDVAPRPGYPVYDYYHPTHDDGSMPYSSPVGGFAPNGYGLYDMTGNMYEWCWDWYLWDYYSSSPSWTDPRGPSSGSYRVARGGSWLHYASLCRAADRGSYVPGSSRDDVGFRPARSAVP